jgi:hypothetical protein
VVLGIGVVETASHTLQDESHRVGVVERVSAVGLFIGPGDVVNGLMLGASQRQSMIIDTNVELLLECISYRNGSFSVNVAPVAAGWDCRVRAHPCMAGKSHERTSHDP